MLECVPNFSEGRDARVIAEVRDQAAAVRGVTVLDLHSDPDHHRSVLTLAGDAEALREAVLAMARVLVARVDMNVHRGVHPRTGALDVVPFVPLDGSAMTDAVAAARETGRALAKALDLPVYLYGEAAEAPGRRDLPGVRRGGFEGLREDMGRDAARTPDLGPDRVHPTAGAVIVGARAGLVACNVMVPGDAHGVAEDVAAVVRGTAPGGLPGVRALAFPLPSRSLAQVSMNILDWRRTGIRAAFDRVRRECEDRGARVVGAELVGLAPQATVDEALRPPAVPGIVAGQALEARLRAKRPDR